MRDEHGAWADRARFEVNSCWAKGRTGSIRHGLSALPQECRGVLIHDVDRPHVRVETLRALASCFRDEVRAPGAEARIFLPHDGRGRGHPILIGRRIWREIAAMRDDEPLRDLVRRDPSRVTEVPVDDGGIHLNVNMPEDLDPGQTDGPED
jgi:molybdenum cofactor cytidylyltransferase